MRSRGLLSMEEEDEDEKDEEKQFIWNGCNGEVVQRIAPGLLAERCPAEIFADGSPQQSATYEKTFLPKNKQDPA